MPKPVAAFDHVVNNTSSVIVVLEDGTIYQGRNLSAYLTGEKKLTVTGNWYELPPIPEQKGKNRGKGLSRTSSAPFVTIPDTGVFWSYEKESGSRLTPSDSPTYWCAQEDSNL